MSFSKVYESRGTHKIHYRSPKHQLSETPQLTIDDVKYSLQKSSLRDVKTAQELLGKNSKEKETMKGYQAKPTKSERRKMKGLLMVEFQTCHDLFRKEKIVWEKTNPVAVEKQKKIENFEYKNLERRREQRILKNKLIEQRRR